MWNQGYFHASAGEVEKEVAEIQVDNSTEIVPAKGGRVVHEEVGDEDGHEAGQQPTEPTPDDHFSPKYMRTYLNSSCTAVGLGALFEQGPDLLLERRPHQLKEDG